MTPEALEQAMNELALMADLAAGTDVERAHSKADELLAATLESLGYSEAVRLYRAMPKWYS